MATSKIVVPLVDMKVIGSIKWENDKARSAFWTKLGATPNASGVWAQMATAAHAYAVACRDTNEMGEPNASELGDAFVKGRLQPGSAGALSSTSEATYRSVISTLCDVFYRLPYDSSPVRDFAAKDLGSVAFGSRAKVLRDIAAAHPKAVPSTDDMKKHLPEKVMNLSDEIASLVARFDAIATNTERAKLLVQHNQDGAFSAARKATMALADGIAKAIPKTDKKARGKALSEESAKLLS